MNRLLWIVLCALAVAGGAAWPQPEPQAEMLSELFRPGRTGYAALFEETFLAQVPEAKIKEIVGRYVSALGAYRNAAGGSGSYELVFERGQAPAKITLAPSGRIAGLWFGHWTLFDDTPETLLAAFQALEGEVSVCVVEEDGAVVFQLDPDRPLAVGSAFKLYILKALEQKIDRGAARWEEVIRLRPEWTSLPGGLLQQWPAGSPVTLHTLASLMISLSDNTAADHLLFHLGRSAVEAAAPSRVRPFLSTMELFKLKWAVGEAERRAYLAASTEEKRRILDRLASIPAGEVAFDPRPTLVREVEWQISTRELCRVIYMLKDNAVLSINSGLAGKEKWNLAGFKGGSEPGVLNYTHVLRKTGSSPVYAVSATINNAAEEVDTTAFTGLVSRLIGLLEMRPR